MKTMHFSVEIEAPKEKVWEALWQDEHYRNWASPFSEGSYAESDWKEGSRVVFLSPEGDGMYSTIDKLVPNKFMSFRHIGMVRNGEEMPQDEQSKAWSGAKENYELKEQNGKTSVEVSVDTFDEEASFLKMFPKALNKLKEIAENLN